MKYGRFRLLLGNPAGMAFLKKSCSPEALRHRLSPVLPLFDCFTKNNRSLFRGRRHLSLLSSSPFDRTFSRRKMVQIGLWLCASRKRPVADTRLRCDAGPPPGYGADARIGASSFTVEYFRFPVSKLGRKALRSAARAPVLTPKKTLPHFKSDAQQCVGA